MRGLLHIFPVFVLLFQHCFAFAEEPVFVWIEQEDVKRLEEYLLDHDINEPFGENKTTMLVHSIVHSNSKTSTWLINKGADVNQTVEDISPLMYAIRTDDLRIVKKLIKADADIGITDTEGNTAVFYAAINGDLKITKLFVKQGADLWHKNEKQKTAYDLAVSNHNSDVAKYLRVQYENNLPDLFDGPHIRWKESGKIKVFYMVNDSEQRVTKRVKFSFNSDSDQYLVEGLLYDTLDYLINSSRNVPPDHLGKVHRIMAIGDIHGGYDSLVVFLRQNGVIDSALQWTWGKGHLVFVGDIFDRGDRVTEALWLIYKLEHQASEAGGAVHLILGNHEIMALTGSTSYVSQKYLLLTSKLSISYDWLFSKRTILGQWLRTKNTILIIDDNLFVHAGLSPKILDSGLSMQEINEHVRFFLNHPDRQFNEEVNRNTVMGMNGPFWYRGYMEDSHQYKHLPEVEFEKILSHFKASRMFVGHTNVKQITPLYNSRVYALDVPFYNYSFPMQGLLIEDDVIFLLNSSAVRKQIR